MARAKAASVSALLREITITNFRGIDHLHLSLVGPDERPLRTVVLGGPNGSGKTSVLEACLIAAGHEGRLYGKTGAQAIRAGASEYVIRAVFEDESGQFEVEYQTARSQAQYTVGCLYFSSWRAPKLVGALGITAGRKGPKAPVSEADRLQSIKQYLVNAKAHELFPANRSGEGKSASRYSQVLDDLNRVWRMFYPSQELSVEPASSEPEAGFDVYVSGIAADRLPLDLLSSGQLELFTFAGMLTMARSQRPILLVDEPELHLDPQWHRLILRALATLMRDSQVIAATHSTEVYDSVRSFERRFLIPAGDPRAQAWAAQGQRGEADE